MSLSPDDFRERGVGTLIKGLNDEAFEAPVGQLVDLASLVTGIDGTLVYVADVDDIYALDPASVLVPDGVAVIAAAGGGNWVARTVGRWDDVQGSIGQGAGVAALTVEAYRDTAFLMWFLRHDQNDALNFVYQFPHRWDYAKPVVPHLHILPVANPLVTQVARFEGYYAWSRPGYAASPLPALTGWTTFGPIDVPIDPGGVYVQNIVSLGAITPPPWARESTCLLIWFRRFGTDAGDTYTTNKVGGTAAANIGLISADVHYRSSKQGTVVEYPT